MIISGRFQIIPRKGEEHVIEEVEKGRKKVKNSCKQILFTWGCFMGAGWLSFELGNKNGESIFTFLSMVGLLFALPAFSVLFGGFTSCGMVFEQYSYDTIEDLVDSNKSSFGKEIDLLVISKQLSSIFELHDKRTPIWLQINTKTSEILYRNEEGQIERCFLIKTPFPFHINITDNQQINGIIDCNEMTIRMQ